MKKKSLFRLTPTSFLQTFVIQSIKLGQKRNLEKQSDNKYIQHLGLLASSDFEKAARKQLEYENALTHDQYADVIIEIKNQIGGGFSRISSDTGIIRVENTCCPFGKGVKETPELCQMTSSVFGGIAARNFGYAKVELKKRIAMGDAGCEVSIYLDQKKNQAISGDEYYRQKETISSKLNNTDTIVQVTEQVSPNWYQCETTESSVRKNPLNIVIGKSQTMRDVFESIQIVAPTMVNIMIGGETGVGKEIVARAIHVASERNQERFIAVNCAAIAENLIESALFGHEKGAFTGAYNVHKGFFERACTGTLFLDEIDSLSLSGQAKRCRVLQEGEFERVGGRQVMKADVRIIVASNQSLKGRVSAGEFRKDLFYRLNIVPIHIPALRDRREDIGDLINFFLKQLANKYQKPEKQLGENAWQKVMQYEWPGNIRELESVLEYAFLFAKGSIIEDFPIDCTDLDAGHIDEGSLNIAKKRVACEIEVKMLEEALNRFSGNVTATAKEMGLTPRAIHQKLKKHHIDASIYRKSNSSAE